MEKDPHRSQPARRAATFSKARPDELLQDVLRLGPAPNRSRETFVTVVNVVLVGAVIALLRPEPAVMAALVGIIAVVTAIRWAVGSRKWDRR
ncbi:hypothetical protein OJ997_06595 [Solirubrobacter phytolaccae]|uniref:Uncharacterized protein n=1 Tax=Solirubrobacter phytolaccae TaxID=1404360 RepID=A0A9X3N5R8_9ACTN|nr:hypothetical protein [Solirubrobacter phytolaccae]MDA0179956.1 hypothetical protein [Solirubrobacter phytolaccae]